MDEKIKILYCTDFSLDSSGYKNLSAPICTGLANLGYDIKIPALGYKMEEHDFPFSLLPCRTLLDVSTLIHNLRILWKPDIIINALDITWHEQILKSMSKDAELVHVPYVGIFPVESPPVDISYAMLMMQMDAQLIISKFGTKACNDAGVPAEYLEIGVDCESWRPPTKEERKALREVMGIDDNEFVILTVADNQERKNLTREMEGIALWHKQNPDTPFRFYLVTRENLQYGYNLRSFASRPEVNISMQMSIIERGIAFKKLWSLYALADMFLLCSKAEGLGMPVLEAQACGLPVAGSDMCAIKEHLEDNRGYHIPIFSEFPDVFGNAQRYMVSSEDIALGINMLHKSKTLRKKFVKNSLKYAQSRNISTSIETVDRTIRRLLDEQKK